ncbi:hypothetical protein [Curtobacterium sp. PhB78]|uniref:hypothetical protein n=1 Tax=Curtobacterium sp. PhB78 TaxID=2485102 RepID=UPI000F460D5D|nr:hypothetical protein [Curtobacterium sp. PhB78]
MAKQIQIGPARWNGEHLVTDIALAGERRIVRVGIRERMVLDLIDGRRCASEITLVLERMGLSVTRSSTRDVINRLITFGFIERPFVASAESLTAMDARAHVAASNLRAVWASTIGTSRPMDRWTKSMIATPGLVIFLAVAVSMCVAAAVSVTAAIAAVQQLQAGWVVLAVIASILWSLGVTLMHEWFHASAFRVLGGRTGRVSITRLGVFPLLNTQLDGFGLLSRPDRLRVIVIGPLVSLSLLAVPLLTFALARHGSELEAIAGAVLLVDVLVLALGLSCLPNTDGIRILESFTLVDQLHSVAFRTLIRRNRLPTALPLLARVAVRSYPILPVATVVGLLLAGVLAVRSH